MRAAIALLALVAVVGCGKDSSGPKTLPGTYPLRSVDGRNLPAMVLQSPGYSLEVTDGTITLNANGTFTDSYSFRENDGGTVTNVTIPCAGTWSQSGNSITLEETASGNCGETGTATWDGNSTLTINWAGLGAAVVHRR